MVAVITQMKRHFQLDAFRVEHTTQPAAPLQPARRHKVIAVMPACNAERTLAAAVADIPVGFLDEIILVDDFTFRRGVAYGLSTLWVVGPYWLDRLGIWRSPLFDPAGNPRSGKP
jgi:hypothetical protein